MLTILLYLFHSRRPAEAHCGAGTGALPNLTDFTDFSVDDGLRGREPRVFFSFKFF